MAENYDSEKKLEESDIKEELADESNQERSKPVSKKRKKKTDLETQLEETSNKLKEEQDKYLRLRAEYDNFRKRSQAEKSSVYNNAVSDAIMAILPVSDNIDRALAQENASGKDLYKGIEMIASQFVSTFEQLNVKQIGKKGDVFDPNLHNAVSHIEDDSVEEGIITEVLQKGFMIGDKVIRYAMVQVAN